MNDSYRPDGADPRDPRDPRRGDWRDRWNDDGTERLTPGGDHPDGYADATERIPVTGSGGRGDGDDGGYPDDDLLDGGRPDPVRDFFAAHRAQIQEHEADDLTWQHIRREARAADGSRRRAWLTGAGITATAAVLGLVLTQAFKGGDEPPTPAPPPTMTTDGTGLTGDPEATSEAPTGTEEQTSQEPAPTTEEETVEETTEAPADPSEEPTTDPEEETPSAEPSEPPQETTEPVVPPTVEGGWTNPPMGMGERLSSVRNVPCDEDPSAACSILYLSEDGGRTWGEPIRLEAVGLTSVDRTDDLLWGWGPAGLLRSDDLGQSWTEVPHRGAQVLRVSTWAEEMFVLTGDCSAGTCTDVQASLVDPATEDAREGAVVDLGELSSDALTLRRTQEAIYVVTPAATAAEQVVWRIPVDGQEASSFTPLDHCTDDGAVVAEITGIPRSKDDLLLACQSADDSGPGAAFDLLRTIDGGGSWTPVTTVEVTRPQFCGFSSGNGRDILLAVAGGVWVSHDGGSSFAQTVEHPASSECLISEITYGAGTTYVARALAGEGADHPAAYYRSEDAGDTWHYVVVD